MSNRKQLRVAPRLRVFLCHSSDDKGSVRALSRRLIDDGFDPWLDTDRLLPGHDWELEITRAVSASDVVVVCLSRKSVDKVGFVQKEIRIALDAADHQPEGAIFLIPLRLDDCAVPDRLNRWQWADLFREGGYERLVAALAARATKVRLTDSSIERAGEARTNKWLSRGKPRERRQWERISLLGSKSYAELDSVGSAQTAAVIDISYGGLSLHVEKPDDLSNQFNGLLHVPVLAPVRVVLRRTYCIPADGNRWRVGCEFVS